ncbi:MAG: hypothetical protein RM022_022870 [Nostoc sp. EfeVER01]
MKRVFSTLWPQLEQLILVPLGSTPNVSRPKSLAIAKKEQVPLLA